MDPIKAMAFCWGHVTHSMHAPAWGHSHCYPLHSRDSPLRHLCDSVLHVREDSIALLSWEVHHFLIYRYILFFWLPMFIPPKTLHIFVYFINGDFILSVVWSCQFEQYWNVIGTPWMFIDWVNEEINDKRMSKHNFIRSK